jgi:hypothetical protein
MQQTKTVLLKAADILSAPNAWTQHVFARDNKDAVVTSVVAYNAVCWCAAGAVLKAHHEVAGEDLTNCDTVWPPAIDTLAKHLGFVQEIGRCPIAYIADVNDTATAELMITKIREAADASTI